MTERLFAYKICLFGDGGVGKTTLTRKFLTGLFDIHTKLTMGAEIFVKHIDLEGKKIILQIWDFGGETEFRFLLNSFSQGASGGILMFDITRYATLERLSYWLNLFKDALPEGEKDIPILLVGGKLDIKERATYSDEEALKFAKSNNLIDYIKCSSKTGDNVNFLFARLVREILDKQNFL